MSVITERLRGYNSGDVSDTNPQGLGRRGHIDNFPAALDDLAAACDEAADSAVTSAAAASQQQSYVKDMGTVSRINSTQLLVTSYRGDVASLGRPIRVVQTANAKGHIVGCDVDPNNGNTTITVSGMVIDSGFSELWYGPDPSTAPLSQSSGGGANPLAIAVFGF